MIPASGPKGTGVHGPLPNTLTPPRKCQQLNARPASLAKEGPEEEDDSTSEPKSATPLIGLRLNDDPPKFWLTRNFATLANNI